MSASDRLHLDVDMRECPRIVITLEKMPGGTSVTTTWHDAAGAVTRQDCHLILDRAPPLAGDAATL